MYIMKLNKPLMCQMLEAWEFQDCNKYNSYFINTEQVKMTILENLQDMYACSARRRNVITSFLALFLPTDLCFFTLLHCVPVYTTLVKLSTGHNCLNVAYKSTAYNCTHFISYVLVI